MAADPQRAAPEPAPQQVTPVALAQLRQPPPDQPLRPAGEPEKPLPWQIVTAINLAFFGTIFWFVGGSALVGQAKWLGWAYWGPTYWTALAVVTLGLVVSLWVKAETSRKAFVLTLLVVPVLLSVVVGIVLTPVDWQHSLIRVGFIMVACLLPAAMYYLFVVTRKGSLLNEFVANLDRLGLLQAQGSNGSEIARKRRVEAYLQKFEAMYGPIPDERARSGVLSDDPVVAAEAAKTMRTTLAAVFLSEAAVPVLVATFLIALLWVVTLPPIAPDLALQLLDLQRGGVVTGVQDLALSPWWEALRPNLFPTTAAFLGAYFFALQLLFYRYIRRDLRPNAYVSTVRRILVCIISIWVVEAALSVGQIPASAETLIVVGFVIGVFPRVLFQLLELAWKKIAPTLSLPRFESDLPIDELDGLTLWHEARLEEEDIENVPNVASADLPELMISTRFPAHRLVDWVDQAILYTCLGSANKKERRDKLAAHGIRTATALLETYRQAAKHDNDVQDYEKILGVAPRSEVRGIADAIETMPNLRLVRAWHGLPPEGFRRA